MTKEQLVELVSKHLIKLDKNNILHPETVSKIITMTFNQILYDTFRRVPYELDLMAKEVTITPVNGEYELQFSVYQLPEMAQFRRFSLTDDPSFMIVSQPVSGIPIYQNLDVGLIDTTCTYSFVGKKLKFERLPEGTTSLKGWVLMTFDSLDDNDEVYIPSGKGIDFYKIAEQIFSTTQGPNLLNQ